MGVNLGASRWGLPAGRGRAPARWAAAFLILLGLAGGLLAAGAGSASAQARGPAFPAVSGGHLYGVRCTSAAHCWAVGYDARGNQVRHWSGH